MMNEWGASAANSKLFLHKVKRKTVQGQTAQEFLLSSAGAQCPLLHSSLFSLLPRKQKSLSLFASRGLLGIDEIAIDPQRKCKTNF